MKSTRISAILMGRKDTLWLQTTFCRRFGLRLVLKKRKQRFGYISYEIYLPNDLSSDRVVRAVRSQRARRKLLKLTHGTGRSLALLD